MGICKFLFVAAPLLVLDGCATSQAALDQANNGAGLIAQLELSLTDFRRVEANAEKEKSASLRDQQAQLVFDSVVLKQETRARQSAGGGSFDRLVAQLLTNADGIGADAANARAGQAAGDAALGALLQPLPSTKAATMDAQKKLAMMGSELSRAQRWDEFQKFAEAIRANVAANKDKIKAAEAVSKTQP